jgi:hypothetical protein
MKRILAIFGVMVLVITLNSCEKLNTNASSSKKLTIEGTWVRLPGPSGDRTDLAIGGITGQPDNRVYMCEKKGSTVAGLYKGLYSNNTIIWDAEYGLPNFSVKLIGIELELDCSVCLPTKYQQGTWSDECGPLTYPTKNIAVGLINNDIPGITITGLTIDGIITPLQLIEGSVTSPDCSSANGHVTVNSSKSQHLVIVQYLRNGVSYENGSMIYSPDLAVTCNQFKFRDNGVVFLVKF